MSDQDGVDPRADGPAPAPVADEAATVDAAPVEIDPAEVATGRPGRPRSGGPEPLPDDDWAPDRPTRHARPVRRRVRLVPVLALVSVAVAVAATVTAIVASPTGRAGDANPSLDLPVAPVAPVIPVSPTAASAGPVPTTVPVGAGSASRAGPTTNRGGTTSPPSRSSTAAATVPPLAPFTGTVVGSSGRCLDDNNNVVADGNAVKVFACNGTSAQTWTIGADHTVRVHDLCLHPEGATAAAGSKLDVYTCSASPFEIWQAGPNGSLVHTASALCLTDPTDQQSSDRVLLETCDGGADQRWTLTGP